MKLTQLLKEAEETYKPPQNVSNVAKRILALRDKHGDDVKGGTRVGWTRANQLANREELSYNTIKRMYSFFSRHKGNESVDPKHKNEPWKDNGWTSWLIWGGDPAFTWVKKIVNAKKDK